MSTQMFLVYEHLGFLDFPYNLRSCEVFNMLTALTSIKELL